MDKRRLLKLAALLEADAKKKKGIKFDMRNWGTVADHKNPMSCGTTACAIGLAAISGAFKRAGLGYRLDINEIIITMHGVGGPIIAASELFGISLDEAEALFIWTNGQGAIGELTVAKRIRDFVAGKVTFA